MVNVRPEGVVAWLCFEDACEICVDIDHTGFESRTPTLSATTAAVSTLQKSERFDFQGVCVASEGP